MAASLILEKLTVTSIGGLGHMLRHRRCCLRELRPVISLHNSVGKAWPVGRGCRSTSSASDRPPFASTAEVGICGGKSEVQSVEEFGENGLRRAAAREVHSGPEPSAGQIVEMLSAEDVESHPRLQRPFVDRTWVEVKAGNGGNPAPNSVRKNANAPQKGPGYGGHGGSVYLQACDQIESFLDVPQKINADHGPDGKETSRGIHAKDYCLQVPLGTIVRERTYSGERTEEGRRMFLPQFRYQFLRDEDTFIVARGGTGGIAPISFKKKDGRLGTPGQRTRLELELRVLNDCAFLGKPNAGKTSLLAALSRAHTRIGPEEYSTTRPHIGVIRFRDRVEVRMCDLPGIKEGASEDKLMGRRILRHTYRSRVLAFVIDMARGERSAMETLEEVEKMREEAIRFDPLNGQKPWLVIGTKCDALHRDALYHLDSLHFRLRARHGVEVPVVGTSSRFGLGLTRLVRTIRQLVYPDLMEPRRRLPAEQFITQLPGVLHGKFDGDIPSLGENLSPPLLLPFGAAAEPVVRRPVDRLIEGGVVPEIQSLGNAE